MTRAKVTKRSGGTGLGLAVAQQIVTDHCGQIVVDSEAGAGTTFYVALPLAGSGGEDVTTSA